MSVASVPSRTSEEPPPPARVGDYVLGAAIGRGGMGRVHEAVHEPSGRLVAIKLVKAGASERACGRLLREARSARAAAGEQVVEVLDAGLGEDGLPFVVMERLQGEDLGAVLRREGRLELDAALHITTELLRGLESVHAAGVVHRDLKPENLVLLAEPSAETPIKIVDFGVSKVRTQGALIPGSLTREGVVLGTPMYMSPEQAQGLPDVDERSDLWSTGAILFQCLAGRAPHAGGTYEQIVVAVCSTDAPDVRTWNPAVPAPIAAVVARSLARDRRRRFQDARAMREALERAATGDADAAAHDLSTVEGLPGPSSTPALTEPLPLRRTRRRGRVRPIAIGVASLVAGGVLALLGLGALGLTGPVEDGAGATAPSAAPREPPHAALVPVEDVAPPVPSEAPPSAAPPPPRVGERPFTAPVATTRSAPRRKVAADLELRDR
jgi:serine/threonine protein kinase